MPLRLLCAVTVFLHVSINYARSVSLHLLVVAFEFLAAHGFSKQLVAGSGECLYPIHAWFFPDDVGRHIDGSFDFVRMPFIVEIPPRSEGA